MAIWNGLLFGMMLQLSVGPVCLAVLHRSMTRRLRDALMMVLGVALADAVYMVGAIGGLSLLLQIHWVKQMVLMMGALILTWFGIQTLRAIKGRGEHEQVPVQHASSGRNSFWHGVLLTLANPLTVLFWAGVFGSLLASGTFVHSTELFLFATGCLLSTFLFLGLVALLAAYLARFFRPGWLNVFHGLSGVFLIGFATVLYAKSCLMPPYWPF
ncbi:LysE family translocator [Brevibacillus formosus]|uniref:LysE family translocator n=1 Tax=Brevibacillus TaxID=55080 RepID=UPI000D10DDD4|nr:MULTISPECIES: LysE family translocator [Brevibacillus]MBG9943008.1 threonine transporter RhtB [Brevibacillus formosus]MED1946665.1 LysE family translocator [Brevibacillus formosus]MED1996923.1 LysE family translocator [Brevibacillus formosus]MED2084840.1 LysE family translocator [Brevibacillus formosus]PSK21304.1 threonine transporter RhtB [Brevibacillus sp. NRRL NRS-603]